MALLKTKTDAKPTDDRDAHRVFPVDAPKLTKEERKAVTDFARSQGLARGAVDTRRHPAELRGAPANNASRWPRSLASACCWSMCFARLPQDRSSRPKRSTNCSTTSARRSTIWPENSRPRNGDSAMAKTTWGRKETIIWPRHVPIYTYGTIFLAVVVDVS